jgi:hypothetical protein
MSQRDRLRPDDQELRDRVETNEPLLDTPALNALEEADLPLRGGMRENILIRVKASVRERRTVEGISSRLATNIVSPISSALEDEAQDRVRKRVVDQIKQRAGDRDE